ncbi:MAG: MFS transporter [Burkholderiales bacterium]|nr:MFS transporter [Burkholderiales bacterium]
MASGIRMWIPFAMAYAASFFQRTSLQTISDLLAIEFNVGAYEIGLLAGAYFATYAVIQVPAGIISDRVGPQKAVLISMVLSFLGTSVFLMAWSYPIALTARSITAIGDAFAFSALIKYVALYLPAHRFGLMSGASQVSGYVGGAIATAPLAICADAFGWRSGFLVLNAIILALLILYLRAERGTRKLQFDLARVARLTKEIAEAIPAARIHFRGLAAWLAASVYSAHFLVLATISGVWGVPLLTEGLGYSRSFASLHILLFLAFMAIGSIVFGLTGDKIGRPTIILLILALIRTVSIVLLQPSISTSVNVSLVMAIVCVTGLTTGGTVPLLLMCIKNLYHSSAVSLGASVNGVIGWFICSLAQPAMAFFFVSPLQTDQAPIVERHTNLDLFCLVLATISASGALAAMGLNRVGADKARNH